MGKTMSSNVVVVVSKTPATEKTPLAFPKNFAAAVARVYLQPPSTATKSDAPKAK
jgi:hypothetical protein